MNELTRLLGSALDPDWALQASMNALIEATAMRYALRGEARETWSPGKPLKLYLAGYVGARNTGADVRVEEMIRQLRALVGDDLLELTLPAIDRSGCARYFRAVRLTQGHTLFLKLLFEEVPKHHGVVACEGSMFKSKFASALSTMMAGALGMATAEGKLSVGYGAEAGDMEPGLRSFVERQCRQSLILCRNEQSQRLLERLGIRTAPGADTAWTFEPAPPERGQTLLREAGWDGARQVLALCPINPFWWPVKPDLWRALDMRVRGAHKKEHYKSVYFHHHSDESTQKYAAYIDAIVRAVAAVSSERQLFVILIGMEQLDRRACEDVAMRLGREVPMFVSDDYDMYDLVSVLRQCAAIVSSRYHAIVTSMPARVPSAGITMDERISNLMTDRGDEDLLLWVDDPDLSAKLQEVVRRLLNDGDAIKENIGRCVPGQLRLMGEMGISFVDELRRTYPDIPVPERPRSWEHHLPPLSTKLERLADRYL